MVIVSLVLVKQATLLLEKCTPFCFNHNTTTGQKSLLNNNFRLEVIWRPFCWLANVISCFKSRWGSLSTWDIKSVKIKYCSLGVFWQKDRSWCRPGLQVRKIFLRNQQRVVATMRNTFFYVTSQQKQWSLKSTYKKIEKIIFHCHYLLSFFIIIWYSQTVIECVIEIFKRYWVDWVASLTP